MDAAVEVGMLGPLKVRVGGRPVIVGSPKLRSLLAALALSAGRPVDIDELAYAVWGADLPEKPRRAVQLYLTRLRTLLDECATGSLVTRLHDGYVLGVRTDQVDVGRFEAWQRLASQAANAGDLDGESRALRRALAQWRGDPLEGVPSEILHRQIAPKLREQRLRVLDRHIEIELHQGRHAEVAGELSALTAQHPLHEPFWAHLITALHASGRRADALDAYHRVRETLATELGVDPGERLQALHATLLMATGAPDNKHAGPFPHVPRQLPARATGFAGRVGELRQLDDIPASDPRTSGPAIAVIAGMAGVGKTALALQWARHAADRFPDGQIWLQLHGHDRDRGVPPAQALTRLLHALGLPDSQIPFDPVDRAGLYRSLMDGRRILVVLDDASSVEQVRPLLPGAPGAMALVTSRSQLSALVASEGARPLALDVLDQADARDMVVKRVGERRARAEPAAVDELVELCARLPLALATVAARATSHPDFALAELAAELRTTGGRLDAFTGPDRGTEMRAVFSWSYRRLSPQAARLFRLLAAHPGPHISRAAAASVAGLALSQVHQPLAELCATNLLAEVTPGRYAVHDLLRAYAAELSLQFDADAERQAATHRMLEHYLQTAQEAAGCLQPWEPRSPSEPCSGVTIAVLTHAQAAFDWFGSERQILLALIRRATDGPFPAYAWKLAATLVEYVHRNGHWHDWLDAAQLALDGALRRGEPLDQGRAHRILARASARLEQYDLADDHCRRAIQLFTQLDEPGELAHTYRVVAAIRERQERYQESLDLVRRALDLHRAAGDRAGEARALNETGWLAGLLGDYREMLDQCRRALTALRGLDDRFGEANTLDSIGYAQQHLGRCDEATASYTSARNLARDIGAKQLEGVVLGHLGDLSHAQGDLDTAQLQWREALAVVDQLDPRHANRLRDKLATAASRNVST